MKIADSRITMQSTHLYTQQHKSEKSLRLWVGDRRPDFSTESPTGSALAGRDTVSLSIKANPPTPSLYQTKPPADLAPATDTLNADPKLMTMRYIIEAITGRKIEIANISELQGGAPEPPPAAAASPQEGPPREGWGLEYDSTESYTETEELNFSASGTILTQDGKKLDFTLTLSMQRAFAEENSMQLRLGDARLVDPLVINYEGNAAQLTDTKFSFDLNSDGTKENISHLQPGSGFLFLDKNNDGIATNGAELFGPSTGSGFAELSTYDLDHNGWLDENDPVYKALLIWSKDSAGSDYFASLAEKNIGAIYLEPQSTQFSLKDQANTLHGKIQNTGLFFRENGQAGSVQEIHLTV